MCTDTGVQHGGKDLGEGICMERLERERERERVCVCYSVWIDWDGVVEGGTGCDYVHEEMGFACDFSETSMCAWKEKLVCVCLGDGKTECQHSRNQRTKIDWNG